MSEKGLAVLQAALENNCDNLIAFVCVGRDKNVVNDYSEEITQLCNLHNITWCLRGERSLDDVAYSIAVSWRWLLPNTNKLIVFHDSPLPRYRGFNPLVNQLIQGENEIGVTALFASEEYDKGDVLEIKRTNITYPITIHEAIQKTLPLYNSLGKTILGEIMHGLKIQGTPQDESQATYSLWRDEQDYYIDWTQDAEIIERFINATGFPYLGAKAKLDGIEVLIYSAKAEGDVLIHNRDIGKVIFTRNGKPLVVCGKGLLLIQNAEYSSNGNSIFPLNKFRSRFSSFY